MKSKDILKLDSLTFDVTQEDIDRAEKGNSKACPIAHAVNRTLGLPTRSAYVCDMIFRVEVPIEKPPGYEPLVRIKHVGIWFDLPRESTEFIRDFDSGAKVQPFTFTASRMKGV